jgi:hypothetical protein
VKTNETANKSAEDFLPLWKVWANISRLWFIGASIPFILLVVQTVGNHYGEHLQEAWAWFIPTVAPTLGLIIGVVGSAARTRNNQFVRRTFYTLAWWLSLAYLLLLPLTIALEPMRSSKESPVAILSLSNYWLSPLQSLVVAALGYIFTSKPGARTAAKAKRPILSDTLSDPGSPPQ